MTSWTGIKIIDRSPCGTGTSARVAQRAARGLLKEGETFVHESFIGTRFVGRIERRVTLSNGHPAVVPSVEGEAFITGLSTQTVNSAEPFAAGFLT